MSVPIFPLRRSFSVNQIIALAFGGIILLGTLLLALPVASRTGESCGLLTALFTATSATCVTGLALADSWTQWSLFGQVVLLGLIEVGGLGFMSAASVLLFVLRRKIDLNHLLVMAQSIGGENINAIWGIQKRLLLTSLAVEGVGAAVLAAQFWLVYRLPNAIWLGIFHSVSAFCNAGFDLMGFLAPGSSIIAFAADPIVCLTLAFLIIFGGLGFLVWDDIYRNPSPKKWSVYTKLVMLTTLGLLFGGAALYFWAEAQNPATLGAMPLPQKLLAAFFQSATTRTAGFAALDQNALTETGKLLTMFLMFVGGSSGSTAGGLKTVTFVVLLLFLATRATGRKSVVVFHRTVPEAQIMDALTIYGLMVTLCFFGAVLVCADSGLTFTEGFFEVVSALATVGLSTGVTARLHTLSRLLLIGFMYIGRVGILTLSMGFLQGKKQESHFAYPATSLLIG